MARIAPAGGSGRQSSFPADALGEIHTIGEEFGVIGGSINMLAIQNVLDRVIKDVWLKDIAADYNNDFLLKEDSLKNAFYYHVRRRLTDNFLVSNCLRIYTEFHLEDTERADIAIVELKSNVQEDEPIQKRVQSILAIIELKYKNESCDCEPFFKDVDKVKRYIKLKKYNECQFYLGFIHERHYSKDDASWLTKIQREGWAKGRLTELVGHYEEETDYFETKVI